MSQFTVDEVDSTISLPVASLTSNMVLLFLFIPHLSTQLILLLISVTQNPVRGFQSPGEVFCQIWYKCCVMVAR